MRNNRKKIQSAHFISESHSVVEEYEGNPFASSEDDEERRPRRSRRGKQLALDFTVEILEFEGQLHPDKFIDWMNIVERCSSTKMSRMIRRLS